MMVSVAYLVLLLPSLENLCGKLTVILFSVAIKTFNHKLFHKAFLAILMKGIKSVNWLCYFVINFKIEAFTHEFYLGFISISIALNIHVMNVLNH